MELDLPRQRLRHPLPIPPKETPGTTTLADERKYGDLGVDPTREKEADRGRIGEDAIAPGEKADRASIKEDKERDAREREISQIISVPSASFSLDLCELCSPRSGSFGGLYS